MVYAFKMRRLFRKCRQRIVLHAPACRQIASVAAALRRSPADFRTNPSIRRHGCPQELLLPLPHAVEDAHKSGDRRHQQHRHCQDHRLTGHFGSSGSTGALRMKTKEEICSKFNDCLHMNFVKFVMKSSQVETKD